eukprot:708478-Rhodomonas_salina.1
MFPWDAYSSLFLQLSLPFIFGSTTLLSSARSPTSLRACYAVPGTDGPYGTNGMVLTDRMVLCCWPHVLCDGGYGARLMAYARAMRCPVLTERMVLGFYFIWFFVRSISLHPPKSKTRNRNFSTTRESVAVRGVEQKRGGRVE